MGASGSSRGLEDTACMRSPAENEETPRNEVNKVTDDISRKSLMVNDLTSARSTRASKRLRPPEHQVQRDRMTRQMSRASHEGGRGTSEDVDAANNVEPSADYFDQHEEQTLGDHDGMQPPSEEGFKRGSYMGKGLDKISRGFGSRIKIHIAEGFKRPVAPMEAAKLASEAGMVLRQHIPVFTKWKEYKRDDSYIEDLMGKLAGSFELDIKNEAVISACTDMLKVGQRQLRYKLKKLYFDGVPANQVRTTSPVESMTDEQWGKLVEMWSDPKHKEKCEMNKLNRARVMCQQRTGSRSYIAHLHDLLSSEKYKDVMPTAIDLFKECHFSKKKGFSPQVKEVIDEMEAIVAEPVEEGQEPVSPTAALTEVLPTSTFLDNICMSSGSKKRRGRVNERNIELEAELEMEKEKSEALKKKVEGQEEALEDLRKQVEEANNCRMKQADEIEHLKKGQEDMNRFFRRLFENQG